jgi:phosphoglucomutase
MTILSGGGITSSGGEGGGSGDDFTSGRARCTSVNAAKVAGLVGLGTELDPRPVLHPESDASQFDQRSSAGQAAVTPPATPAVGTTAPYTTTPSTELGPKRGQPLPPQLLPDILKIQRAYTAVTPDPSTKGERVKFGTSGHRGVSLKGTFNEPHILSIAQAICDYRRAQRIDGPCFVGADTHAISGPAFRTVVEVLLANGMQAIVVPRESPYSPTPVISHAILAYNRGRTTGLADGIIITPSHNPPTDGGIKYNEPYGGPADTNVTNEIENRANAYLDHQLEGVRRGDGAGEVAEQDLVQSYVADLPNVIDFDVIRKAGVRVGIDPLGGSSVDTWRQIIQTHGLRSFTLINDRIDPAFPFVPVDHDGKVRQDPSSRDVMAQVIERAKVGDFALIGGNDTDADRFGVVTPEDLVNPNHFLAVAAQYLFENRRQWSPEVAIGKTLVSSAMIDRVGEGLGRRVIEVPVGFKWFVSGLYRGEMGMAGEESAGMSFLRQDGSVWTTEKDGPIAVLLAAEMTARTGRNPAQLYAELTKKYGKPEYERRDVAATPEQQAMLGSLKPSDIKATQLAGDPITAILTTAPGNGASIGGLKIVTRNGWVAVRPSGTEPINKTYAESFVDTKHLGQIFTDVKEMLARL